MGVMTIQSFGPWIYGQEWVVAKVNAPNESIQDTINLITDAASTKRYKIEVLPGIYDEAITMKAYVDVTCPYGMAIIKPPAASATGVIMATNSMLQGFQVDMTNGATTGIAIAVLDNVIVEDCWVTGGGVGDIGVTDASTGTSVLLRKLRIDSAATCYQKTAAGTTWLSDSRITSATDGIDVDINLGTLDLHDNELMGTGTGANVDVAAAAAVVNSYGNTLAGDRWQIANSANAKVYSHQDSFTKVTHAGVGFMVSIPDVQTYYVYNGMHIGDALTDISDAAAGKRYTIHVFSGAYAEVVTMKQYVDLVGESNQSVILSQAAATVIICAADSRVKGVQVQVSAASTHNAIRAANVLAYLENVVVTVTHFAGVNACLASTGTGGFEVHDSQFTIDNVADYPVSAGGSGTHVVYDSEMINTGAAGSYGFFVAAAVTVRSFDCKLRSSNGWYLTADVATLVLSSGDTFTNVTFSGATGIFVDLTDCKLYTCAGTVDVGEWVYVSGVDTVTEAKADALTTMPSIGVAVYKPTATSCYVKQMGYVYDSSGPWVTGSEYWLSAATAGVITTVMPGVWPQRVAIATSTQRLKVVLGDNLGLAGTNVYTNAGGAVAVSNWVYISGADLVLPARANVAATMPSIGVVVQVIDATTCRVKLRGKHSQATKGWAASDDVYVSDLVAGDILNAPPVMGIVQKVAEVKHDDGVTLLLEIA